MTKALIPIFIGLLLLCNLSCKTMLNAQNQYIRVNCGGLYSFEIPQFMQESGQHFDNYSIRYSDVERVLFFQIIPVSKLDIDTTLGAYDLHSYFEGIMVSFLQAYEPPLEFGPAHPKEIGGLPAYSSWAKAGFRGARLFFQIMVIEDKNNFYQLFSWTDVEHQRDNGPAINRMMESFRKER